MLNYYFLCGVGVGGFWEIQNKTKPSSISNEMMQISTFSVGWGWVGVGVGGGGWGWEEN